jgi:hypothetical protein
MGSHETPNTPGLHTKRSGLTASEVEALSCATLRAAQHKAAAIAPSGLLCAVAATARCNKSALLA